MWIQDQQRVGFRKLLHGSEQVGIIYKGGAVIGNGDSTCLQQGGKITQGDSVRRAGRKIASLSLWGGILLPLGQGATDLQGKAVLGALFLGFLKIFFDITS